MSGKDKILVKLSVMDKVIIFGAGRCGNTAYHFYKDVCNIICYVDNNAQKWGTFLYDKEIVSPEVLRGFGGKVIIAVQKDAEQIGAELKNKYGVNQFLEFGVRQRGNFSEKGLVFNSRCIVVEYTGGLGNQLFQFALAKYLEYNGCDVAADITHYAYVNARQFEINRIFKNIHVKYASDDTLEYYFMKDKISKIEGLNEKYIYTEPDIAKHTQYAVSEEWGNLQKGIVKGYFQTYLFADKIRDILLRCLEFPRIEDQKLQSLADEVERNNSVSIHVRRGDYLLEKERRMDGICDVRQYYTCAIERIAERISNPCFYVFSDDISWCKRNLKTDRACYIDARMFKGCEDWYDMYLMSRCKHNIIANSSFSWWGAWLNENENKIVIAPKKWDNFCNLTNVCPPSWDRI